MAELLKHCNDGVCGLLSSPRSSEQKPAPEVLDFIRSISPIERPKVLDLGCGLGRHAIAFALAQFLITATDASATAVQHVVDWASSLHLSIEARVCDVLDDSLPNETNSYIISQPP
jgi:predicted RNA methylase